MVADTSTPHAIDILNSLLRRELGAVEVYAQAIHAVGGEGVELPELDENRHCHRERVPVLSKRIVELGGQPATVAGEWGPATAPSGGALSRQAVIAALEEAEDRGLTQYSDAIGQLDADSAAVLRRELLPAQGRSHARMSALERREVRQGKAHGTVGWTRAQAAPTTPPAPPQVRGSGIPP